MLLGFVGSGKEGEGLDNFPLVQGTRLMPTLSFQPRGIAAHCFRLPCQLPAVHSATASVSSVSVAGSGERSSNTDVTHLPGPTDPSRLTQLRRQPVRRTFRECQLAPALRHPH